MFMNIFNAQNSSVKSAVVKASKSIAETLEAETSPEELIQKVVTSAVMKDEDIHFLMTSFRRKFGVTEPMRIVPLVEESTLNVTRWAFVVGAKSKVLEAGGMNELISQLTASIIDPMKAGEVGEKLAMIQE